MSIAHSIPFGPADYRGTVVSATIDEGLDALPRLRTAWETLFMRFGREPSTSYEWTAALVRHHINENDQAYLVQLTRNGDLVGVVPLVVRAYGLLGRPFRILRPLSEDSNTHSDLLLDTDDPEVLEALVSALLKLPVRWDCFRMARLLESDPRVESLGRQLANKGCATRLRPGLPAYVLALPDKFEDFLTQRSAKFRNHLRRTQRKLLAKGRVAVHRTTDQASFVEGFDALLRVERASWKHQHGSAITAVRHQSGFYRDLAEGALAAGRLHLQWLTLDGEAIAYNLGYLTTRGYHYLKTSFDDAYRQLGPSTVLRAALLEDLIAEGVRNFDFPGEPYEWETQWTDTLRWRVVFSAYGQTLRGRLLAAADRLRRRTTGERRVQHVDPRRLTGPAVVR